MPKQVIKVAGAVFIGLLFIVLLSTVLPIKLIDFEHFVTATRMLLKGENPYRSVEFFAPPWIFILLAPLTILPLKVASAIWLLVGFMSVVTAGALVIGWGNRRFPDVLRYAAIISPVLMPAAFFSYITGQISPLVTLAALLALWLSFHTEIHPITIGVALAVAVLKPHIVVVPVVLSILELFRHRRWRAIRWTLVSISTVMIISFAVLPTWVPELLGAWMDGDYRGGLNLVAPGFITLKELGIPFWVFLPLLVYVIRLWVTFGLNRKVIALTFITSLLLVPYSRSYDLVVLGFPFSYALLTLSKRSYLPAALMVISLGILPLTTLWVLSPAVAAIAMLLLKSNR
jgi:hypothetical protein